VHNNVQIENIGTSACLVNVDADLTGKESCKVSVLEIADNMAMQILGTKPKYLYRKDIPETLLEEEKDRIKKEMEKTLKGKTPEIINNIVEGKLKKFYEDNILMDMEFILENDDGIKVKDKKLKQ
jgi:elongation factor Ts